MNVRWLLHTVLVLIILAIQGSYRFVPFLGTKVNTNTMAVNVSNTYPWKSNTFKTVFFLGLGLGSLSTGTLATTTNDPVHVARTTRCLHITFRLILATIKFDNFYLQKALALIIPFTTLGCYVVGNMILLIFLI